MARYLGQAIFRPACSSEPFGWCLFHLLVVVCFVGRSANDLRVSPRAMINAPLQSKTFGSSLEGIAPCLSLGKQYLMAFPGLTGGGSQCMRHMERSFTKHFVVKARSPGTGEPSLSRSVSSIARRAPPDAQTPPNTIKKIKYKWYLPFRLDVQREVLFSHFHLTPKQETR
ncbi:hypothetical protein LY78DRAFT_87890 [Colletotrichum sublineola]|nr:hypothetical protein LY78DRAFT_87890 [Colletotrichum sublineola]